MAKKSKGNKVTGPAPPRPVVRPSSISGRALLDLPRRQEEYERSLERIRRDEARKQVERIARRSRIKVQFDKRQYHPDKRVVDARRLVVGPGHMVGFVDPRSFGPCLKRKVRREIMFAKKLRFKGSGARRHKWSELSGIRC